MYTNVQALNSMIFSATENNDDEPEKVKNAIATVPTTHLVGTGEEIDGLDVLDPEDIATSRIKLLQPTSDEVRHIAEVFRKMKQEGRIQVADEEETQVTPQPVVETLTDDQRRQIIEFVNDSKLSHQELEQLCSDEFSKGFDELSKSEGVELLNRLMSAEPTADDSTPF